MKNKYFWLLGAMLVAGTFTFTSCSDDDDDNGATGPVEPVNFDEMGGEGFATLANGTKISIPVPDVDSDHIGGVSIYGNELSVSISEYEYDGEKSSSSNCYISIPEYTASKTVYENVDFSFYESEETYDRAAQTWNSIYTSVSSINNGTRSADNPKNRVTVQRQSDGSYKFVFEGDISVSTNDIQNQGGTANATISLEITLPLAASGETLANVSSKQSTFPSFTPWLDGKKAEGVMKITNSQLVKSGVLLWYYDTSLGYSDYENLKAQAVKALGDPVNCYDASKADAGQEWTDIACSYFYKDHKFIMVSYCPWRYEEGPDYQLPYGWDAIRENHAARIQVHAFEGVGFDYENLINAHW